MRIGIVGAGLAGLACAQRLQAAGHGAVLFDKGRGPGGRMSARRVTTPDGEASFDHGAQYFTARDPAFRHQVEQWCRAGCAAAWPAAGADAWVGVPAMNAPIKALSHAMDVRWNVQVTALRRRQGEWLLVGEGGEEAFDVVVVAIPAEQAAVLLAPHEPEFAARATSTVSEPCWTLMAAFAEPLSVAGDVLRGDAVVGWAARNSAKPGRTGPESWVVQGSAQWSRAHLECTPADIVPMLLGAFAVATGVALPRPSAALAHRWRFAKSGAAGDGQLWSRDRLLGVCGDWLLGPRVECAWLSGTALASEIADAV